MPGESIVVIYGFACQRAGVEICISGGGKDVGQGLDW